MLAAYQRTSHAVPDAAAAELRLRSHHPVPRQLRALQPTPENELTLMSDTPPPLSDQTEALPVPPPIPDTPGFAEPPRPNRRPGRQISQALLPACRRQILPISDAFGRITAELRKIFIGQASLCWGRWWRSFLAGTC